MVVLKLPLQLHKTDKLVGSCLNGLLVLQLESSCTFSPLLHAIITVHYQANKNNDTLQCLIYRVNETHIIRKRGRSASPGDVALNCRPKKYANCPDNRPMNEFSASPIDRSSWMDMRELRAAGRFFGSNVFRRDNIRNCKQHHPLSNNFLRGLPPSLWTSRTEGNVLQTSIGSFSKGRGREKCCYDNGGFSQECTHINI